MSVSSHGLCNAKVHVQIRLLQSIRHDDVDKHRYLELEKYATNSDRF